MSGSRTWRKQSHKSIGSLGRRSIPRRKIACSETHRKAHNWKYRPKGLHQRKTGAFGSLLKLFKR